MDDIFELPPPTVVDASANSRWGKEPTISSPTANDQDIFETPPPKPISKGEDIARSAAGQGALGLTDVAGMIGSAGQLYDVGAKKATKYLVAKPAEYLGLLPKGKTAEDFMAASEELGKKFQTPAEQAGAVNYIAGVPVATGHGVESVVKEAAPFTAYEPKTTEGKYAGSAARMATGMAELGGLPNAARNLTTGAVAGLVSEGSGQAAETYLPDWANPYARFFGAVVGSVTGNKLADAVKYVAMPNATAEKLLVDALAADIKNGHSSMSVEEIQKAIQSGATPTAYDMAGPQTKSVLQKYGYLNDSAKAATSKLSETLEKRKAEAGSNLGQHIDDHYSGNLNPAAQADAIAQEAKIRNDTLYSIARNDPKAQSLWNKELDDLAKIDPIKSAMKQADSVATDPASGIVKYEPGKGAKTTASGIVDQYGNPISKTTSATPPTYPNLTYWDQVKRNLDDQISSAVRSGERDAVRRLTGLKDRLVTVLDNSVGSYKAARDSAADAFGGQNALEAGYNYFRGTNSFTNQQAAKAFKQMNDKQKDLFAQGGAGYLKEVAENQGPDAVLRMMNKPIFANRMKSALGQETFDSIYGRAQAESLLSKTKEIPAPTPETAKSSGSLLYGAAGALGTSAAEAFATGHLPISPSMMVAGAIGGGLGLGARAGLNAAESRIAPSIMEMASDPKRASELGKLAQENSIVRSTLDKMNSAAVNSAAMYYRSNPGSIPIARFAGGRIGRASGGKVSGDVKHLVDRLMTLANQAKKATDNHTKPLLDAPDASIVKALRVANEAI
jgi:hypothetical protein